MPKDATLRVGVGKGADASFVRIPFLIPQTVEEWRDAAQTDAVLSRWCERAYRIEHQENSGAREYIAANPREPGETQDEYNDRIGPAVQEIVDSYDPTVEKSRGGPRTKNVEVDIEPDAELTAEQWKEMMRAKGVNISFA